MPLVPLTLAEVAQTWGQLRATRSRKKKTALLGALMRGRSPDELGAAVRWLTGSLTQGPIGVGFAAVYGAVKEAPPAASSSLDAGDVDAAFDRVAAVRGEGSQAERHRLLVDLFQRSTELEQGFLVGLLTGELRQGALAGVMEEALAEALGVDKAKVQRAAMLSGDLPTVAVAALEGGDRALEAFRIEPLRALQPMLAKTAKDPAEALKEHGTSAFEAKLDGVRIQVHRDGELVKVFTRNLNEVSAQVPEVVAAALALPCRRVILDGELLSLDDEGRPRSFQTVMSRFGREADAESLPELVQELPLRPFWFDCLLVDERPLLDLPGRERTRELEALTPAESRVLRRVTSSEEEAAAFLDAVLAAGHEGLIAKDLEAPYEAGGRGKAWLKIKPARTFDLVVLACDWGSGRRTGKLSNLHLGVRDPESGHFLMLGKTFKGMSDAMLAWQTRRLQELEVRRTDYTVHVRPELVVEVAADSVMPSSRYPAGLSLRFARVRAYRPDKDPAQASTLDELRRFLKA